MRPFAIMSLCLLSACSAERLVLPYQPEMAANFATMSDGIPGQNCVLKTPLVYYVLAGRSKGNGSFGAPFGTIGEALTAGATRGACHLRVLLRGGTFPESFVVPVPHLEVSAVGGRNVIAGSIVNTGRWLSLRGVVINATGAVGLRQDGGRLQLALVSVNDAQIDQKNIDSGVGVWLSGGALATLDLVVLDGNGHQAIRLEGAGTAAWLAGVRVSNTGIHPVQRARILSRTATADDNVGAVQVSAGAKAIIRFSSIMGSTVAGLHVDHGAEALVVRSQVSETREIVVGAVLIPAINVVSQFGAVIEAFFLRSRVATADLMVANDGFLTMHHGVIGTAEIGLVLVNLTPVPGYSPFDCATLDGTRFTDVARPLQSDYLPIPPDPLGEGPPPVPLCRHVTDDPRPF